MYIPGPKARSFAHDRRQDLLRGADALGGAALHKALEVNRRVLAGEEHVALAHALVPGDALMCRVTLST